ncbi:BTB/POZ domain-containing protein 7 isoform X1 [Hydra vulgaris]|uniref:BTB/POZ domain-containing protein 7 isoform X1 n=1 Tax=Hydra vulgaris TaxID=6087 RepID=UPI001F5FA0D7|nr:BTB/POZ domain-containing protein 7 isoform X1 [Hydra vulgaris]
MGHAQSAAFNDKNQSKSSDLILPHDDSSKLVEKEKKKQSKKLLKQGSIRKKLSRTLRPIKSSLYSKQIRDLVQSWSITEIQLLLKKYETLEAVRELKFLSDSARSINGSLQNDFCQLFYSKHQADTIIEYKDTLFHVHKIVLISRCQYFRSILIDINHSHVKIDCDVLDVNISDFIDLISYIYCGYTNNNEILKTISVLEEKFGLLNTLENDMQKLFNSKERTDLVISYRNGQKNMFCEYSEVLKPFDPTLKVDCHLSIVCSRSPFLKRLFETKYCNQTELTIPLLLEINDHIVPQPFLHVVMECIYFDQVSFNSIFNEKFHESCNNNNLVYVEIAMKVFEIGQFLEIPSLMRGCEDIIVSNLSATSLIKILEWSSIDSKYVYRQAIHFLREEFIPLCKSSFFLANLSKIHLLKVLESDFLQADEETILDSIITWCEWEIAKSGNPTIILTKSLPRHPCPKRYNITNDALREMVSSLVGCVRLSHILTQNSVILSNACQQGLLQMPFTACDIVSSEKKLSSTVYWIEEMHHSDYVKPRFFIPYFNEIKLIYQERLTENKNTCDVNNLPSTLVEIPLSITTCVTSDERQSMPLVDIFKLSEDVIKNMVTRQKELMSSEQVLKYLTLAPDNVEIIAEIQLRVVREFDYPDELANEIFQQYPDLVENFTNIPTKRSTLSMVGDIKPQVFCNSTDASNSENMYCSSNAELTVGNNESTDEEQHLLRILKHSSLVVECPLDLPINATLN